MKKILIVDDDRDLVQSLALRCQALGLEVFTAYDCLSALQRVHSASPDIVCLDLEMPGSDGLSVAELVASDPARAGLPIILLTGHRDKEIVRRCRAINAYYLLKGPNVWDCAGPIIRKLMQLDRPQAVPHVSDRPEAQDLSPHQPPPEPAAPEKRNPRVLVIDDDPDISAAIRERLLPYGVDVLRAFSGMQGFWTAVSDSPDVILLDISMPDGGGNYILARLRDHSATVHTPVIVLTGLHHPGTKRQMISSGAAQYLVKPLVFEELLAELRRFIPITTRRPVAALGAQG